MSELSAKPAKKFMLYDYNRFPLVESDKKTYREAYGRKFKGNPTDAEIELKCAGMRLSEKDGGLGEIPHFKRVLQLLFPYLEKEWHHWLDWQLESMLGNPSTDCFLGPGGIGKSWVLGTIPTLWQMAKPLDRGVLMLNTTQKSQTERAFKYVADLKLNFSFLPGKIVGGASNPRMEILVQDENGDVSVKKGVGVVTQTIKKGKSSVATADIKGFHPKELMVICEEANHLHKHHLDRARANWITNNWYKIVLVGNPEIEDSSEDGDIDALYSTATPAEGGWGSIKWGRDYKWKNVMNGTTYHFSPNDSPRVLEPGKFIVSTWLPSAETLEQRAEELGGKNTALYKQQVLGIFDHEALPYNPITESMCEKFKAMEIANLSGLGITRWAAYDPAFSGNDEAFLKIAQTGITTDGKMILDFMGELTNFSFHVDPDSPLEPSFQQLEFVRRLLKEYKVPYENFVMDATAIGISIGDIFTSYLSPKINKVKVSGTATDILIDEYNSIRASDRYANRSTELWLSTQRLIVNQQLRGLDKTIVKQLCERPAKVADNGKIKILEKSKFRQKYGYSPDRADCASFICDLVLARGLKPIDQEEKTFEEEENIDLNSIFVNRRRVPFTHQQRVVDMGGRKMDYGMRGRNVRNFPDSDIFSERGVSDSDVKKAIETFTRKR